MSRTYFVSRSLHEENLEEAKASSAALGKAIREPDGGFTIDPHTGKSPTKGFALSVHPKQSVVIDHADKLADHQIRHAVKKFRHKNVALLNKPGNKIGGWNDPDSDTHKGYLDVSTVVKTPKQAFDLGKKHDQKSYFDVKNKRSVVIDRNAKSGQK